MNIKNLRFLLFTLATMFSVIAINGCKEPMADKATAEFSPFFIKDVNQSILTKVDPEILLLVEKDLLSKGRLDDAKALIKTYNIKDGILATHVSIPQKSARTASAYSMLIGTRSEGENWVYNQPLGGVSGTTGQHLALYAFQLDINPIISGSSPIRYQAHVQNVGWQGWKVVGEAAGTSAMTRLNREIQAVQFDVDPSFATNVFYRAHVGNLGWQAYVSNGQIAGTTGQSLRMEAFQLTMLIY